MCARVRWPGDLIGGSDTHARPFLRNISRLICAPFEAGREISGRRRLGALETKVVNIISPAVPFQVKASRSKRPRWPAKGLRRQMQMIFGHQVGAIGALRARRKGPACLAGK